jgi:acetyl esterase/lipase
MTNRKSSTDNKAQDNTIQIRPQVPPPPAGASDVLREAIVQPEATVDRAELFSKIPQTESEWLAFIAAFDKPVVEGVQATIDQSPITVERDEIEGVNVYHVIPDEIDPAHKDHLFVHIHGGAYILNGGEACMAEAIAIALGTKMRALSIDYRMAPRHPYPAAVDDVVTVYRHLLTQRPARSIAMGGSSAGGGLTLNAVQQLIKQNIDVPGALFVGTPGSDLSGTGDTFYTNRGVDRNIPVYEGTIEAMIQLYADGHDLKDPRISAIYGDFHGFPPTLLVTGTRDLFLSNTARTHIKLLQAGVVADLLVYEGVSHGDYLHVLAAPEAQHFLEVLDRFFTQHLQLAPKTAALMLERMNSALNLGLVRSTS